MTNPQTLSLSNPPARGVPIHRDCSLGGLPASQIWSASKMSNFDLPPDTPGPEPASLNLTVKPHPGATDAPPGHPSIRRRHPRHRGRQEGGRNAMAGDANGPVPWRLKLEF